MFKCWQVRVIYAPDVPFGHSNDTSVSEISDGSWVDLTRYDTLENQVHIILLMHVVEIFIFSPKKNPRKSRKYYKILCFISILQMKLKKSFNRKIGNKSRNSSVFSFADACKNCTFIKIELLQNYLQQ